MAFEIILIEVDCDIKEQTFSTLSGLISPEKKERIDRLHHRRDAVNALMGDIAVRWAICSRTGLSNRALFFSSNSYGKRYLHSHPEIQFNISHSGNWIACAVNDAPVGIDIERFRPFNAAVANRYFRDDERQFIGADPDRMDAAFCQVWTMKESYVKWQGKGLSTPLSSFSILEIERQGNPKFHPIDVRENACCCVCTDTAQVDTCDFYRLSVFLERIELWINS